MQMYMKSETDILKIGHFTKLKKFKKKNWLCWGRRQCGWGRSKASQLLSPGGTGDPGKASTGSGRLSLTTSGPSETWFQHKTRSQSSNISIRNTLTDLNKMLLTLVAHWWCPVWPTSGRVAHFAPPADKQFIFSSHKPLNLCPGTLNNWHHFRTVLSLIFIQLKVESDVLLFTDTACWENWIHKWRTSTERQI